MGPDRLVAVCMERSADMIVAVLGVLGAGAAYLPIDPHNGEDRIRYMLTDGCVSLLLIQSHLQPHLSDLSADCGCRTLAMDDPAWTDQVPHAAELRREVGPQHPAYVIYTSGSTGNPKGVVIAHRSLVNLCHAMTATYGITDQDRILQFASLSFDMSVEEIFLPAGWCRHRDPVKTPISKWKIFIGSSSTTVYRYSISHRSSTAINALEPERQAQMFNQLRLISFGGEALRIRRCKPYKTAASEYSTPTARLNIPSMPQSPRLAPAALDHRKTDRQHLPVCAGQTSRVAADRRSRELHIAGRAGAGLSKQSKLDRRKVCRQFVRSRQVIQNRRFGALAADGNIAYVGRTDHQVKIRGFRVELGEIENALDRLPGVKSAVAIVAKHHSGGERLVACYTADAAVSMPRRCASHCAVACLIIWCRPDSSVWKPYR
jgi:non-ribosomal peptide synthetase component F